MSMRRPEYSTKNLLNNALQTLLESSPMYGKVQECLVINTNIENLQAAREALNRVLANAVHDKETEQELHKAYTPIISLMEKYDKQERTLLSDPSMQDLLASERKKISDKLLEKWQKENGGQNGRR